MTTATPPAAPTATPAVPRRPRNWIWATGSVLAVVLVVVLTLAGRSIISHARQAAQVVPPQTLPPLTVITVIHPDAGAALFGVDTHEGHLAALTYAHEASCPPVGACPAEPALTSFVLYDDTTGAQLATTPLTGALSASAYASELLVDSGTGFAYAISAHHIDRFGMLNGQAQGGYDLPADASGDRITGALVGSPFPLYLISGETLLALNADTGKELAHVTFTGNGALSGPVLDETLPHQPRLYILQTPVGQPPILYVCDANTLRMLGSYTLPVGVTLGPLNGAGLQQSYLYTFGADGVVGRINTNALVANGGAVSPLTPDPQPALTGAQALGWDTAHTRLFAMGAISTEEFASDTSGALTPVAMLPLSSSWPCAMPLLVDTPRGVAALPIDSGDIALAHEDTTAPTSHAAPNAATAAILARAALAKLLPDTNQDPPFVTPQTFPLDLTPGVRATNYWILFSDLGWRGPYPGSARTSVTPTLGTPNVYTVTFSIDWDQLFVRQHTWTCEVQADGAVRLISQSGDDVP